MDSNAVPIVPVILNVGLCSSIDDATSAAHSESLRLAFWYKLAKERGGQVYLQHSNTEPTLVIYLEKPPACLQLAIERTQQGCIAAYYPSLRQGCLIGPKAKAYGPFLREYFVMSCGRRLSDDHYMAF